MSRCMPVSKEIPPMKDLTSDNITENVKILNNQTSSPRVRYVFDRLVSHVHDFVRETCLSTEEWQAGIDFLTAAGQISNELRSEMTLLSDTLGVSLLVDAINHPRHGKATEGTVLGPFHTHDAPVAESGYVLHEDQEAAKLLVLCSVQDTSGEPVADVVCDVWEGDAYGFYDVQNPNRIRPDGRALLRTNKEGKFHFTAVVPVPYPIPMDGPVGKMLTLLKRHPNRPGHIHFMLRKAGYDNLITALYPRGDPYETSDPVFGVKESLVVDLGTVNDQISRAYNVPVGTKMLKYDFVLVPEQEARELRAKRAEEAVKNLDFDVDLMDGLPVLAVD